MKYSGGNNKHQTPNWTLIYETFFKLIVFFLCEIVVSPLRSQSAKEKKRHLKGVIFKNKLFLCNFLCNSNNNRNRVVCYDIVVWCYWMCNEKCAMNAKRNRNSDTKWSVSLILNKMWVCVFASNRELRCCRRLFIKQFCVCAKNNITATAIFIY